MKIFINTFFAAALTLMMFSCNNDDDTSYTNNYTALGFIDTTGISEFGFVIDLDLESDPTLIPVQIYSKYSKVKHGDRVAVLFSLLDDEDINNDEADAVVHTMSKVTLKDIVQYSDSIATDLGNDVVYLDKRTVWQNDSILNIIVGYMGNGYGHHTVNLALPDTLQLDDERRYILDVYHNDNGFGGQVYFEGIISFSLNSLEALIPNAAEGIEFVVRYNNNTPAHKKTLDREYTYPYTDMNETFSYNIENAVTIE